MTLTREDVLKSLDRIMDPDSGKSLVAMDYVRAVTFDGANIRFILEVPPALAPKYEPVRAAAEATVKTLPGVGTVSALLTAHSTGPGQGTKAPPQLKIGGHPKPQAGPELPTGVKTIIAVGSGKGGVGKSTVSANLAVALAQAGKRVGLLDADVYGPSQPRMMGVSQRPASPDGKTIIPLRAHGVTMMSIGLMLGDDQAVVWRGPMLMGALQQMLGQVEWGQLDTLIVDLPPGTGDVQLTLCQKSKVSGAIVVSTPQDVALLDARKAVNMFEKLNTPILGVIENMSTHICTNCGHESHIFGDGGAKSFAEEKNVPFLGAVPLNIDIRLSGDEGAPLVAANPDAPEAQVFHLMAKKLIDGGIL